MVVFFLESGMFTRVNRRLRVLNLVKNLNIVDIITPFYKFACFTTKRSGSLEHNRSIQTLFLRSLLQLGQLIQLGLTLYPQPGHSIYSNPSLYSANFSLALS